MKILALFILVFLSTGIALGQNELAPIVHKELVYKDWVYKNVQTDVDMNLRKFTFGKKLVMVVYWAPWCPNWKYDAAFVQGLYEKYKGQGFDVIGVAEYDPVEKMKAHIKEFKLTFPNVYESVASADREKTVHFSLRREAGDMRKWGSPWYVFLEVSKLEPEGLVMAKKLPVVNGELIRPDAEKFIREKLGLPPEAGLAAKTKEIEICDPDLQKSALVKP